MTYHQDMRWRTIVLILLLMLAPGLLFAASEGPNNPGTVADGDTSFAGSLSWNAGTLDNAKTSNDSRATSASGQDKDTNWLNLTNFGFAIPTGATINGVITTVERRKANANTNILTDSIMLMKGGSRTGTAKDDSLVGAWTTIDATETHGSSSDVWGANLSYADVNGSGFGVSLFAGIGAGADTNSAEIDHVAMTVHYTADTTAPTVSTFSPTDGATSVGITDNLVITFTEAVDAESGNITIYKSSNDSVQEAIGVTSGNVTGSGTTAITINPTSNLENGTSYYVQIDATAFDDIASNSYAGISDKTTWNFSTANTAPSVNAAGSISQATNGTGYVTFTTKISDSDADLTQLLVEYSTDQSNWKKVTIGSASASQGSVTIDNNADYQIQSIDTDTGEITLTIIWQSKQQFTEIAESTVYLRLTPYDGITTGTAKVSESFAVDNKAPVISNFRLAARTNTSFTLAWDHDVGQEVNFDDYELCYGRDDSQVATCGTGFLIWDTADDTDLDDAATLDTTITPLRRNTLYSVKLTAGDTLGNSAELILHLIRTSNQEPFNLILDSVDEAAVLVHWDQSASPTFQDYQLCYGRNRNRIQGTSCNPNGILKGAISLTFTDINTVSHLITNFAYNTLYYIKAFLHDSAAAVNGSNLVVVTTCGPGEYQSAGVCLVITPTPTPIPTPTPTATPTPTPTPEPSPTPSPSPEPSPEPSPSPESTPPPGADEPPGTEIVTFIQDVVDTIVTTIKEVAKKVIKKAVAVVKKTLEIVRQVAQDPVVQTVAVATVPLAAVAVISSASLVTAAPNFLGELPFLIQRIWQALLGALGFRTKKRPWGRVVKADSGMPLAETVVQVYDHQAQKLVETLTSSAEGSFSTYLKAGTYEFRAHKAGWALTPQAQFLRLIGGEHVYDGRAITVTKDKLLPIVLAMRPLSQTADSRKLHWYRNLQRIELILASLSWPLLVFGSALNTITVVFNPSLLVYLIESLYILLVAWKLHILYRRHRALGTIADTETGQPIDLATVQLYDATNDKLVATRVTNYKGQFFLMPPQGVYTIRISRVGYEMFTESHLVFRPGVREALALSISLKPAAAGKMQMNLVV